MGAGRGTAKEVPAETGVTTGEVGLGANRIDGIELA